MNLCVGALMVLIAKPSAPAQREGSPLRAFLSLVLCKEQLQKAEASSLRDDEKNRSNEAVCARIAIATAITGEGQR